MNISKLSLSATAVAVAAVLGTACTREVVVIQAPPSTTTTVATTTTEPTPETTDAPITYLSDDELFLNAVSAETALGMSFSDRELLDLGNTMCQFLRAGGTADELIQMIVDTGMSTGITEQQMLDYAGLAGLAVRFLCPDQGWKI